MVNDSWRDIAVRSWYDGDLKCIQFALTCSLCGSPVIEESGVLNCVDCGKISCPRSSLLHALHSQALLSEKAYGVTSFADEASLWLLRSMKLVSRMWSHRPRFFRRKINVK